MAEPLEGKMFMSLQKIFGVLVVGGSMLISGACGSDDNRNEVVPGSSLAEFNAKEIRLEAHAEWDGETSFEVILHRAPEPDCIPAPASFGATVNGLPLVMIENGVSESAYDPDADPSCGSVTFEGSLSLLEAASVEIEVTDETDAILYVLEEPLAVRRLEPLDDNLVFARGSTFELHWLSPTDDDLSYDGSARGYIDDGALPLIEIMDVQLGGNGMIAATLPSSWTGDYQAVVKYDGQQRPVACDGVASCTHWVGAAFDSWITIQ